MPLSDYLADALLDHAFGGPSYTRAASVFFTVFTTNPATDGTGGVEPGGVTRASRANNGTTWQAASSGKLLLVTLDLGDIGTPTLVGIGVYDAVTSGNLLAVATKDADGNPISITPNPGDHTRIPSGLLFTLTPGAS